jgi:hypothetical protein
MSAGPHSLPTASGVAHRPGRSRALRAVCVAALAAAGVAASAAGFSALWPHAPSTPQPTRLSAAEAAAAREVVARARALVSVTPQQLGYRLRIAGPLAGVRGQTDTAQRTITLFVSPHDAPHRVAHDLGHEIGHAFDAQRLNGAARAGYLRARGVSSARWSPGAQASDYESGAGDFAEVFALCHTASPEFRSRLAARPVDPCRVLPISARGGKLDDGS